MTIKIKGSSNYDSSAQSQPERILTDKERLDYLEEYPDQLKIVFDILANDSTEDCDIREIVDSLINKRESEE